MTQMEQGEQEFTCTACLHRPYYIEILSCKSLARGEVKMQSYNKTDIYSLAPFDII